MSKPRVGISACLLGHAVRHDGGHRAQQWLIEALGPHVTWEPWCPEVEMGLGVPRETLRLVRPTAGAQPKLISDCSGRDLTAAALAAADGFLAAQPALDGYVLKSRSPSCGLARVNLCDAGGTVRPTGTGIHAARLQARLPSVPLSEEGPLHEPAGREHFVTRIFMHHRLRRLGRTPRELRALHRRFGLLLLAHSPAHHQRVCALVEGLRGSVPESLWAEYRRLFLAGLARKPSRGKGERALRSLLASEGPGLSAVQQARIRRSMAAYRAGRCVFAAAADRALGSACQPGRAETDAAAGLVPYPRELMASRFQ